MGLGYLGNSLWSTLRVKEDRAMTGVGTGVANTGGHGRRSHPASVSPR